MVMMMKGRDVECRRKVSPLDLERVESRLIARGKCQNCGLGGERPVSPGLFPELQRLSPCHDVGLHGRLDCSDLSAKAIQQMHQMQGRKCEEVSVCICTADVHGREL